MIMPDCSGPQQSISVIVPVYNEAAVIEEFHLRLSTVMGDEVRAPWEVIYVNDGSTDQTLLLLQRFAEQDLHVAIVNLSRNFGKEIASTAGLDYSKGAAVILIDADLQDPPELIPELIAAWRSGYDIAYATRRSRLGDAWLKRATAHLFYRTMKRFGRVTLPHDAGDFRLMSRRVVQAVRQMREHHRFMKGMFAWVGFPSKSVPYDRHTRLRGSSKWSYWALMDLAIEGITSFTLLPLKVSSYVGLITAILASIYAMFILAHTLITGIQAPGYPSLMIVVLFLGGIQLLVMGVIGEYLGRIFNETKNRPLYFVERYTAPRSLLRQDIPAPNFPSAQGPHIEVASGVDSQCGPT